MLHEKSRVEKLVMHYKPCNLWESSLLGKGHRPDYLIVHYLVEVLLRVEEKR